MTSATSKAPPPIYPVAGTHVLPLKRGAVVDLILQVPPSCFSLSSALLPCVLCGAASTAVQALLLLPPTPPHTHTLPPSPPQNLPANSNNGDYRVPAGANRTAQEQHPFHLHGQHFWVRFARPAACLRGRCRGASC